MIRVRSKSARLQRGSSTSNSVLCVCIEGNQEIIIKQNERQRMTYDGIFKTERQNYRDKIAVDNAPHLLFYAHSLHELHNRNASIG